MAKELVIDVDYNISKAEAKQKKLEADWELQKQKIDIQKQKVSDLAAEMELLTAKEARQKAWLDSRENFTVKQAEAYEKTVADLNKITNEHSKQTAQLQVQEAKLNTIGANIKSNIDNQNAFSLSTKKSTSSMEKLANRIGGLIKRVFIFSLITKALRAMRKAIGDYIKEDSKLSKSYNQLTTNLKVIGNQIMQSISPAISFVLNLLVRITSFVAQLFQMITGNKISTALTKINKKTKDINKTTEKATASFDTLQKLSSGSKSEESTPTIDDSALKETYTDEFLTKVGTVAGLAAVGLGIILCATGHFLIGIPLILLGAGALVGIAKQNWNAIDKTLNKIFGNTKVALAGAGFLAIGIFLLCCNQISLGLGFILAGATTLAVSAITANWDKVSKLLQGPLGKIMAIGGSLLIGIGLLLIFSGVGVGLGLGLLLAGGVTLGTAIIANWDKIPDKIKSIATKIGKIFTDLWDGIKKGFKVMANGIITMANIWIDGFNTILLPLRAIIFGVAKAFGSKIKFDNVKIPHIPKLAQGTVIPGGSPFLAYLGDQPRGQTNIEAPLETIVEAFRQVSGNQNYTLTINGTMAEFVKAMNPVLKREQRRASMYD